MQRSHDDIINEDNDGCCSENGGEQIDDISRVLPHELKSEKLPASPVFTPEFARLTKSIKAVVELLATPLNKTTYRGEVTDALMQETKTRSKTDIPEEVRLALVGDVNAGMCLTALRWSMADHKRRQEFSHQFNPEHWNHRSTGRRRLKIAQLLTTDNVPG
jgi:hypothetical protein